MSEQDLGADAREADEAGSAGLDGEPLLNRRQLALSFDVSENTIDKWIKKGMPVEQEGGNGVSYAFRHCDCLAWRERELNAERDQRAAADLFVQEQRAKFLNIGAGPDRSQFTPSQLKDMAQAELVHMQASRQRRALVPVEEMIELFDGICGEFRSGLDGLPDWMEREFGLSPDQVERAIKYFDGMMQEIHDRFKAAHLDADGGVIDESDQRLI